MMRGEKQHRQQNPHDKAKLEHSQHQRPFNLNLWEVLGGILLIVGYMFATSPAHKVAAVWIFFAALVLIGLGIAIRLTHEFSATPIGAEPPNNIGDRPYMFFQGANFDLASMKNPASPHVITFHFQNGGKSPAFGVGGQSYVSIVDTKLTEAPVGALLPNEPSRQFVSPGSVINQSIVCKNIFGDNAEENVTKIENGEKFLYIYGHMDYEDRTSGTKRNLKFCGLYNPAIKQFETMPFGNEVE